MIALKDLTKEQLKQFFEEMGEKPFRAKQVFQWIYRGASGFDEMTDLSRELREKLKALAYLDTLFLQNVQSSKTDGTKKYLFGLSDGKTIESVFMKYNYGNSLCVSSQVGCRMGCRFCASGLDGLERNLTPGEMVDQILLVQRETGERISHIVFMGMGEPLDNYENVHTFIKFINDEAGLHISLRNITVSTCGLIPGIEKLAEDLPQINLAVSLHSVNETVRSSLMPVNKKFPVKELLETCRSHTEKTKRRFTFEYALIEGVNDSSEEMNLLADYLQGMLCHVNLIPLNSVAETNLKGSSRKQALEAADYLEGRGISATVRRELGRDIDGACGQLRLRQGD